jgi:hypothetical protein
MPILTAWVGNCGRDRVAIGKTSQKTPHFAAIFWPLRESRISAQSAADSGPLPRLTK